MTVSDGSDSATASVSFVVTECDEIDEINAENVTVYPNPASTTVNIEGITNFTSLNVAVVNLQGQVVREIANSLEINVSDVESGIYFIKISCDGQQYLKKIVIK